MQIIARTLSVSVVLALVLTCVIPGLPSSLAEPTLKGETLPNWDLNTIWEYRYDNRSVPTYTFSELWSSDGSYQLQSNINMTPTIVSYQTKMTLVQKNTPTNEYKLINNTNTWENGTWIAIITHTNGDPNYNVGDILWRGNYRYTNTCSLEMYHDMRNLNLKRDTGTCRAVYNVVGGINWVMDSNVMITETTTNGIDAVFKPNWDLSPMKVGDVWAQADQKTTAVDTQIAYSGDITGASSYSYTTNSFFDFTWTVDLQSIKTIDGTKTGSNDFQYAYQMTRTGKYDWDYDDGTNYQSGTQTPQDLELWYACGGMEFDAGSAILIGSQTHILWSNFYCFKDRAPILASPPPEVVNIEEDKHWVFQNGVDYSIVDNDPGTAGVINFTLAKQLGTRTDILLGLDIDVSTGKIDFIPVQADVADGYNITITATDNYEMGPRSVSFSFSLNVKNTNDPPVADLSVMEDTVMNEGDSWFPTWNLSQVFSDPDQRPNPLMGGQPYDPIEKLFYSAEGLGDLSLLCPDGKALAQDHQCSSVHFFAPDVKFPKDTKLNAAFKATDTFSQGAQALLNISVKHVNHKPVLANGVSEFVTEANVGVTLDLQSYFGDPDVNNPNYITNDALLFQPRSGLNLSVEITGFYAKVLPTLDWCGKSNVSFRATDKAGAYVEGKPINITVQHCGPQFDLISWSPMSVPKLQEAAAPGAVYPGEAALSITLLEKRGPLTYIWTVEDLSDGRKYHPVTNSSGFLFKTDYYEDFYHGVFSGTHDPSQYRVSVNVSDGRTQVHIMSWNISVINNNKIPTISGVEVFKVLDNGKLVKLPKSPSQSYDLELGTLYVVDVSRCVSDLDEGISYGQGLENLSRLRINWSSEEDGINWSGPVQKVGAARTQSGYFHLSPGANYLLIIRVTDKEGAYAQLPISLKVMAPEKTYAEKSDYSLLILVLILLVVVIAIVLRIVRQR